MAEITLTAALRSNLLSLQGTQKLLDTTQLRLSTGKKVNSALDNPNSFFASQALQNRAGDLSRLLDGMGQSIQTLKAADNGITQMTKLVEQAQAAAQSARDAVSNSGMIRSGDMGAANVADITTGAWGAGDFTLQAGAAAAVTITVTAGMSLSQLVSAINANSGFSAQIVEGSVNADAGSKRLEIRATNGETLTIGTGAATAVAGLNENTGGTGGVVGFRGDTGGVIADAAAVASTSNSLEAASAEIQFNRIRDQINQLVTDTGYRGTNLLNGDTLRTQFNERNTSFQSIVGVTFDTDGLGLSSADYRLSASIDASISEATGALETMRAQAKAFGNYLTVVQTRQDFTENLINTLKEGSDKLTLADKNEEGANLLALQTSQQLGITALSLASQAAQSVLRLFG